MFPTLLIPTPALSVVPGIDTYFSNVVLLAHCDGVDGGTTFVDSSPIGRTLTATGATTSTTQVKFGTTSAQATDRTQRVSAASNSDTIMAGIFTLEFQIYVSVMPAIEFYPIGTGVSSYIFISLAGRVGAVAGSTVQSANGVITTGVWYHIAVVQAAASCKIFVNGLAVSSVANQPLIQGSSGVFDILSAGAGGYGAGTIGYIDEVRFTKGVARYASDFTQPTSASPNSSGGSQTSSPRPPSSSSLPVAIEGRPTLYGVVGTPLGNVTLATVTCTDLTATHSLSSSIPGLNTDLVWLSPRTGTLTIFGTPTGNSSFTRLVVTYLATDGVTVLGSSTHEITIQGAVTLTLSTLTPINGKVGVPINALALATMTSSAAIDAIAIIGESVPGLTPTFTWNRATNSGTLTVSGSPTQAGQFNLTMNYKANGALLNTGSHVAIIDAAYSAPSPAPAPAPAPAPPPAPTPPPASTPAPQPGSGQDPYWSSVRVLLRYDVLATGQSYDPTVSAAPGAGLNWAGARTQTFSGYFASGPAAPLPQGGALSYGPAPAPDDAFWRSGANFGTAFDGYPVSNMRAVVSGCEGRDGNLAVETMVNMDTRCLNALMAGGGNDAAVRYCPVMSLLSSAGEIATR